MLGCQFATERDSGWLKGGAEDALPRRQALSGADAPSAALTYYKARAIFAARLQRWRQIAKEPA